MLNRKAVVEALIFYIIAVIIGIIIIILYVIFTNPNHIVTYISNMISNFGGSILSGLKTI